MRRKKGSLIPLEQSILDVVKRFQDEGIGKFYGWQMAREITGKKAKSLTSFGTLYRALERLVSMGYLSREWEEIVPENENRPRRRYYRMLKGS